MAQGSKRGRFLALLKMVCGRRESQEGQELPPPPPRDAKVSADGDGARRGGRRGRAGVSASHLPLGPHPVDPVLSTLALGRLEFLSPWGGSILCFHHTVFMVTWERRETT